MDSRLPQDRSAEADLRGNDDFVFPRHLIFKIFGGIDQFLQVIQSFCGFGIILEMLANVNLGKDLPLLANQGRVIVIGSRGKVEITPRDLMSRDADVRAMTLFNASPGELAGIHAALAG